MSVHSNNFFDAYTHLKLLFLCGNFNIGHTGRTKHDLVVFEKCAPFSRSEPAVGTRHVLLSVEFPLNWKQLDDKLYWVFEGVGRFLVTSGADGSIVAVVRIHEVVFGIAQGFRVPADVADVAPIEISETFLLEKVVDEL